MAADTRTMIHHIIHRIHSRLHAACEVSRLREELAEVKATQRRQAGAYATLAAQMGNLDERMPPKLSDDMVRRERYLFIQRDAEITNFVEPRGVRWFVSGADVAYTDAVSTTYSTFSEAYRAVTGKWPHEAYPHIEVPDGKA